MSQALNPRRFQRLPLERAARLRAFDDLPREPLIQRSTAITSLGSCFADHIRLFLKDRGYAYVTTEESASGASANWGRIYNPLSMRQVVDYCEQPAWRPIERWWSDRSRQCAIDPYRAVPAYPSVERAEEDFLRHRALAREVLESADVIVLTFGLVEVWVSLADGTAFNGPPPVFDGARHGFRVLEYPETLEAIEAAASGIRRINPRTTLILSVSPVPLRATFRSDVTAVSANAYSKSVLLAATQVAARRLPATRYFPSYEIVTECFDDPHTAEGDVRPEVVDTVLRYFERHFGST